MTDFSLNLKKTTDNESPDTRFPPLKNGVDVRGSSIDHESIHDTQDVTVQSGAHFMLVENQTNITDSTAIEELIPDS